MHVTHLLLLLALLVGAWFAGLSARDYVWANTKAIRFGGDLENAYRHGQHIITQARRTEFPKDKDKLAIPSWTAVFNSYLGFYDWAQARKYHLDYPPMRLVVMTVWSRSIYDPTQRIDVATLPAAQPLITLNIGVAAVSSIGAALLVIVWRRRAGSRPWPSIWCGAVAAVLVWLNPAVLMDAHAWPQWDIWALPFFFFAMLAGSMRWWIAAGLIFGIGSMFKGQLLATAPLLILWPIFSGDGRGFLRLVIGLVTAVAMIEMLWLSVMPPILLAWLLVLAIIAFVVLMGRMFYFPRLRPPAVVILAVCSASLLMVAVATDANFTWISQGFVYGAEKADESLARLSANNLGALLDQKFGWGRGSQIVTTIPLPFYDTIVVTIGGLMKTAYGVSVVLCAIGLAIHTRRRDARALIAMAAPWVLFYALMPQMSGRYLVWGSAATALCAGIGLGPVLFHLLISILSALTITHLLIIFSHTELSWWPAATRLFEGMHPGTGWLTLLLAAVMLYLALTPSPRRVTRREAV